MVFATWQSLTLHSVALADASQSGDFEMPMPKNIADGDHQLRVYVFNRNENIISAITSLLFST